MIHFRGHNFHGHNFDLQAWARMVCNAFANNDDQPIWLIHLFCQRLSGLSENEMNAGYFIICLSFLLCIGRNAQYKCNVTMHRS